MMDDWFTIVAQLINFMILVWLMKRYLYKPILSAIDAREKRVAAELADAAQKQTEALKERDEFRLKNQEFDDQHAAMLKIAAEEASAEKQRLMEQARAAAEALRDRREAALVVEQRSLNHEITRRTQAEVFAIARRTLSDLADANLEARICDSFIRRLRQLGGPAKVQLAAALKSAAEPAAIRSAFELPVDQQAALRNAVNESFTAEVSIGFEVVPQLVGGIEFLVGGQKLAWSIAEYLASVEKIAGDVMPKPNGKTEAPPTTNTASASGIPTAATTNKVTN